MTSPNGKGIYIFGKKKESLGVNKISPERIAEAEKRLAQYIKTAIT